MHMHSKFYNLKMGGYMQDSVFNNEIIEESVKGIQLKYRNKMPVLMFVFPS